MENNNKKLTQQNFSRLVTTKACPPSESNHKLSDLQISNKSSTRNPRRQKSANTLRCNNNDILTRNYTKQQQQQQQQQQARYAEKRVRSRGAYAGNEAPGDNAAGGGNDGPSDGRSVDDHGGSGESGGNGVIAGSATESSDANAACGAGNQPAAGSGLVKSHQAARNAAHSSPACAKNSRITPELNSVYMPGRKKQNHNHLLNFHFETLNVFSNYGGSGGASGNYSQRNKSSYNKKPKYNKEQFLQANFQFVIRANAKPNFSASPDTLVNWDAIEQINIQTTEEPRCPICLYPPIAAKLTRCGHAYCWPCILHYQALSEKTWSKCPICYEAVHIADLKSTSILQQLPINVGDTIMLQLMHREKGSLYIEKCQTNDVSIKNFPFLGSENTEQKLFSKFLLARRRDILEIIEREQRELTTGMDDPDCPEFTFVQQALDLLQIRRDLLGKINDVREEREQENKKKLEEQKIEDEQEIQQDKEFMLNQEDDPDNKIKLDVSPISGSGNKIYYFYQSVDGQNVYLHPLNIKMLQVCYGSLDRAPKFIEGRILQMEHYSMDEHTRRKFTCLGHLPLTRQFAVVEIQIEPPIVTAAVLLQFNDDISFRCKERQRRECEEFKREKKIKEINDRQMGKLIASTANLNLSSSHEFPTWGFEMSLGEVQNNPSVAKSAVQRRAQASYSATLTNEQKWPDLGSSPGTSASASNWGVDSWAAKAAANASTSPRTVSERLSESESTDEPLLEEPKQLSFVLGDVLAEAISKRKQKGRKGDAMPSELTTGAGQGKKNKKSKKMLLAYSTGMNYSGI